MLRCCDEGIERDEGDAGEMLEEMMDRKVDGYKDSQAFRLRHCDWVFEWVMKG